MAAINGDLTDSVGIAGPIVLAIPVSFIDETKLGDETSPPPVRRVFADALAGLRVTVGVRSVHGVAATASDQVQVLSTDQPGIGQWLREGVRLGQVSATQTTYHPVLAELVSLRDRLKHGYAVRLSDVTQIGSMIAYQLGLTWDDQVSLADALAGVGTYRRGYQDTIKLIDATGQGAFGAIAETIGIAGVLQGTALFDQLLTDTVAAGDTISGSPLIMQVVADETVAITATDALQMLYDGRLDETVQITAAYLSPSGSVTTWALNTRTGAVTEYTNYVFNSFAQLDGRYLGAADEGLYELVGDTDDGDVPIIAELESGLVQFAGSRFTSFRAAYIAVRGGGRFVLRLDTGDGKVYNYSLVADHMATTKVNLGKGLRARYFSFTLISTGQDFDLESLEFVPIAARRRV